MTEFRKDAAVHPTTVTMLSREVLEPKKRGPYGPRSREEFDKNYQVHPAVWKAALDAADGHGNRIEVLSSTSVVIHNNGKWRRS